MYQHDEEQTEGDRPAASQPQRHGLLLHVLCHPRLEHVPPLPGLWVPPQFFQKLSFHLQIFQRILYKFLHEDCKCKVCCRSKERRVNRHPQVAAAVSLSAFCERGVTVRDARGAQSASEIPALAGAFSDARARVCSITETRVLCGIPEWGGGSRWPSDGLGTYSLYYLHLFRKNQVPTAIQMLVSFNILHFCIICLEF